jgi:protein phosphatase
MAVVSDGVGGHDAGEIASAITVAALGTAMPLLAFDKDAVENLLQRINAHICNVANQRRQEKRMAATVAALWIHNGQVAIIHCGDSRVYHIQGASIEQLTVDHTEADSARAAGILSTDTARKHPRRHVLQQALGIAPHKFIATIQLMPVQPDSHYLLCTDGLSDALTDAEILDALQSSSPADDSPSLAELLIHRANAAYGKDNVTTAIVHVGSMEHQKPRSLSTFSSWLKGP